MPAPTQYELISSRIKQLSESILSSHPQMPIQLREIHKNLKEDPAIVTLLSEEEICVVVNGLERQTNTFIAASMSPAKTSAAAKKALSKVTSSDLGF